MITLALSLASLILFSDPPAEPKPLSLSLTGYGRFAYLADTASLTTDAEGVRIRALQVSETDMMVGDKAFIGGWSWWRFDCAAKTADRLDFASLRSDLHEGPSTPERQPPFTISPGGDAAELAAVACGEVVPYRHATTVAEGVAYARARMSD